MQSRANSSLPKYPANREKYREFGAFDRITWKISLYHGVIWRVKLHSCGQSEQGAIRELSAAEQGIQFPAMDIFSLLHWQWSTDWTPTIRSTRPEPCAKPIDAPPNRRRSLSTGKLLPAGRNYDECAQICLTRAREEDSSVLGDHCLLIRPVAQMSHASFREIADEDSINRGDQNPALINKMVKAGRELIGTR